MLSLRRFQTLPLLLVATLFAGCTDAEPNDQAGSTPEPSLSSPPADAVNSTTTPEAKEDYEIGTLDFSRPAASSTQSQSATKSLNAEQTLQAVMQQLRPLQGLLGAWRGTTRREFGDFKAVDTHEWIWDLQTEPDRPALVLASDKSPYVRTARLTWDAMAEQFILQTVDAEKRQRQFAGKFDQPVKEIVGDDNKLHKTFRLLFTQTDESAAQTGGEQWQLAWNAQDSNRYLMELDRRRGKARFRRYDTVSTQREGTSFAVSDSDYGEKTCIISQGLGTIAVSYKGRSYWVCCTGCKAAFEADPETWIARAEKAAKKQ